MGLKTGLKFLTPFSHGRTRITKISFWGHNCTAHAAPAEKIHKYAGCKIHYRCRCHIQKDSNIRKKKSTNPTPELGFVFVGDVLRLLPWDSSPLNHHHLGPVLCSLHFFHSHRGANLSFRSCCYRSYSKQNSQEK